MENLVYSLGAEPPTPQSDALPPLSHDQSNSTVTNSSVSTPALPNVPVPASELDHAPVVSLFDNTTLPYHRGEHTLDSPRKLELRRKRERLLAAFPHPDLEKRLLEANAFYWRCLHHTWPGLLGLSDEYSAAAFVRDAKQSESVPAVAKALLLVTVSLQEASPADLSFLGDGQSSQQELADRYITLVADVLHSDEELMTNLDAIEGYVLTLKYELNLGRIRKAWTSVRRAVGLAQLCGFHRLPHTMNKDDSDMVRASALWKSLYATDRWISMLAGLPYSVPDVFAPATAITITPQSSDPMSSARADAGSYFVGLTTIVGHITERNQALTSTGSLAKTIAIEGEMMELAATRPEDWWTVPSDNTPLTTEDIALRYMPQFWHWQGRLLNHLPLMLKAGRENTHAFSRLAALESARKMLTLFKLLRPAQGFASNLCKVIDFQVFTAAMALVLNHFGGRVSISCTGAGHDNMPTATTCPTMTPTITAAKTDANDDEDLALLTSTTAIMNKARVQIDETVVKEATRALELFIKSWKAGDFATQGPARLMVPYYGVVEFEGRSQQQQTSPRANVSKPVRQNRDEEARRNARSWTYPTPPRSHSSLSISYPSSATNPTPPSLPPHSASAPSPGRGVESVQQRIYAASPSANTFPSNVNTTAQDYGGGGGQTLSPNTSLMGAPEADNPPTLPPTHQNDFNGLGSGVGGWNFNANASDPFMSNANNANWNWNMDLTDDWGWFWDNTRFDGMEGVVGGNA